MKRRPKNCAYCGSDRQISKDHVPPKSFFGDRVEQGVNLITVPCCCECKDKYQQLDERLKVLLSTMADPDSNPVVDELWKTGGSIVRGARRPEAEGLRRGLLKAVFPVEIQTPSGLYVGRTGGFYVTDAGIPEFIARTVQALYFYERNERLPDDYTVRFMGTPQQFLAASPKETHSAVIAAAQQRLRVVHRHVFKYTHVVVPEDSYTTIWFMQFYGKVEFAAATASATFWKNVVGPQHD